MSEAPYDPDNPSHAVRWATRTLKRMFSVEYTKWHWTIDARLTLCGRPIVIFRVEDAVFPDTYDDPDRIECERCKKLYKGMATRQ